MISEGSRDWSNDAEKSAYQKKKKSAITGIKYFFLLQWNYIIFNSNPL